jgi:hypothetical protein
MDAWGQSAAPAEGVNRLLSGERNPHGAFQMLTYVNINFDASLSRERSLAID